LTKKAGRSDRSGVEIGRALPPHKATSAFDEAIIRARRREKYVLRLYVAGPGAKSSRALANVRKICEEHLAGRYELEVIDLYKNPVLAKGEQIVAVPTLIKALPQPLRKFIGDMSDVHRVLVGLDLRPTGH
jgi:circadian clock protein KaiB